MMQLTKYKYLNIALFLVALFQFFVTIYFNLFEADIHLGIDSSWDYLKTMIVARNGGIYPINSISDTTAPLIDRQFILAMPLYMILKNINVAYAITNLIFTGAIIYNIIRLMQSKSFGNTEILFVINLFLCPFMLNDFAWQNDLGYFSVTLGMAAMYSLRILEMVLLFRVLSDNNERPGCKFVMVLAAALSIVFGVGSGMSMVAMLFLPLIISRFVIVFIQNDLKILWKWQSLYLYVCILLVGVGRVIGGSLGLTYRDAIEKWVNADTFWTNLQSQFLGYMLLCGAIPNTGVDKSPMSLKGLIYVFGLAIFIIIVLAFIVAINKQVLSIKDNKPLDTLLITVLSLVFTTIFEFSILDTRYGDPIFEYRYLVLVFVSGFLLVAYFIRDLNSELIFKSFGIILLLVCIVSTDLASDYIYKTNTNEEFCMDQMVDLVQSTDAGLVYAIGADAVLYERCMRVYDIERVYKHIKDNGTINNWGDYTYYDNSSEYKGSTILMIPEYVNNISESVMSQYRYLNTIHGMSFYYCEGNPIDLGNTILFNDVNQ